jgi:GTP cyclohydrolase I
LADLPEFPIRAALPDVASQIDVTSDATLDWVGMRGIALPLLLADRGGEPTSVLASASVEVNLAGGHARGIHMSRLYRLLDEHLAQQSPDPARLAALLQALVESQAGLSDRARLELRFDLPLRRRALLSDLGGWRAYPVRVLAESGAEGTGHALRVEVEYSSTCPASAALSRQLVRQEFDRRFGADPISRKEIGDWLESEGATWATPHAQRSCATVWFRYESETGREIGAAVASLIDTLETALATPVQTAVRREDEQEFARLNGLHPMYCEDAARRLRDALESLPTVADYAIRVVHLESLHPHDAVAERVRGVPGGWVVTPP